MNRQVFLKKSFSIFDTTIFHIIYVTFSDRDPPWFNDHTRQLLIKKKNVIFRNYFNDGRTNANYTNQQSCKTQLTDVTNLSKEKYFTQLDDKPKTLLPQ